MKQLAWLHAMPGEEKITRGDKIKRRFGEGCPELDLPPVDGFEHVIAYLFEVGPTQGDAWLSSTEVRHWQELTGVHLSEFEASMLLHLSRVYLGMQREAREKACKAPYQRPLADEEMKERARATREARKASQKK